VENLRGAMRRLQGYLNGIEISDDLIP